MQLENQNMYVVCVYINFKQSWNVGVKKLCFETLIIEVVYVPFQ